MSRLPRGGRAVTLPRMGGDEKTGGERDYPDDVHFLDVDGREFILVGTAHISRESVDLVREVIEKERPDCICIELDPARFEALSEERRWESLDLREVIRKKQLSTLLVNLMLASYQKRLGGKLGVLPGSEMLEAVRAAQEHDIAIALCDRDIRATLRRAWHSISLWRKLVLISSVVASAFERPEISEEDLRKLRQQDVLSELMQELGQAMPNLKRVLIDERDDYLAQKMRDASGDRVVAVVGAGHIEGMREALLAGRVADLESLATIPPVSPVWKWIGWGVPALILASIAAIGFSKGPAAAGENALFWFLANAIPSAVGGILALGHPVTVLAAFFSAPFTSLTPVIGAGYVCAFVQAFLRPPTVGEFQSVGDDIASLRMWWKSRLLRVFLVFILTTVGSIIGTWVGGVEIVSNLF